MDELSEVVLAHYGVKGMKWGVRRKSDSGGDGSDGSKPSRKERRAAKKLEKADKKWEEKGGIETYFKVYNAAAQTANSRIEDFNNQPKYKDKDFSKDSKARREYYDAYSKEFTKILNDTSKTMGLNPSGTKRLEFDWDINAGAPMPQAKIIEVDKVKHADAPVAEVKLEYKDGFVVGVKILPPEELRHAITEAVIAHYGVKGMKWGVRRKSSGSSSGGSDSKKKVSRVDRAITKLDKAGDKVQKRDKDVKIAKRQTAAEMNERVASGRATFMDKLKVYSNVSLTELALNDMSVKKVASNRAQKLRGEIERIESGKRTVGDKLSQWGETSLTDMILYKK